jgi:hypothetical protein
MTQAKNDSRNAAGSSLTSTAIVSRTQSTPSGYRRRNTSGSATNRSSAAVQPLPSSSTGRNGGHTGSGADGGPVRNRAAESTSTRVIPGRSPDSLSPAWIARRPSPSATSASKTCPRRDNGGSGPTGRARDLMPSLSRMATARPVIGSFSPAGRAGGIRPGSGNATSHAYIAGMTRPPLIPMRYRRCLPMPMRPVRSRP